MAGARLARRLSVGHVALALPLVAAVISARLPVRDNSYLWHVRAGTDQIDLGSVLTEDPFSFTALGRPWRTQSWLADLAYGWADRNWGLATVTPIVIIGTLLLVGTIALRCYRAVDSPFATAIATTWIMWLTIGYFTPRPVLFSLALFALFLAAADHKQLRWTLPLILWVWAAVHGGFIVGLGYLALDGLRRKDRSRAVDLVAATGITLLTAHGWGAWEVVLGFIRNTEALDLIQEWLTPNLISIELFPFALGILALLVGAIRGRVEMRDLWVIAPFLVFAFTANRSVPIAALVLAPWIVGGLGAIRLGSAKEATPRAQGLVNAFLLGAVVLVPWLVPIKGGLDQELFAVQAVEHLMPGRAFHDDAVGGYLIYAEWPERLVYIDDRAELYQEEFVDFVNARAGNNVWREVFDRYQLNQALLKVDDPLVQVLEAEGWIQPFADKRFVIMTARTEPAS